MKVYLVQNYHILGTFRTEPKEKVFVFELPFDGECYVEVSSSHLVVKTEFEIERKISEVDLNYKAMKTDFKKIVDKNLSDMRVSAFYFMNLLKYSLNEDFIQDGLLKLHSASISIDKVRWFNIPLVSKIEFGPSTNPKMLTEETSKILQSYINNSIEPFIALKHLQKARKEDTPRHIWIEATIAAELAIKEFLIRLKPELEYLLLELPSPDLRTLYGNVLEHYTGEKFPRYNKLGEGASKRNKLVHRPNEINITYEQAVTYVKLVEDAIYFLLKKLYPNDRLIDFNMAASIQLTQYNE